VLPKGGGLANVVQEGVDNNKEGGSMGGEERYVTGGKEDHTQDYCLTKLPDGGTGHPD